jgi:hypothetical protein
MDACSVREAAGSIGSEPASLLAPLGPSASGRGPSSGCRGTGDDACSLISARAVRSLREGVSHEEVVENGRDCEEYRVYPVQTFC